MLTKSLAPAIVLILATSSGCVGPSGSSDPSLDEVEPISFFVGAGDWLLLDLQPISRESEPSGIARWIIEKTPSKVNESIGGTIAAQATFERAGEGWELLFASVNIVRGTGFVIHDVPNGDAGGARLLVLSNGFGDMMYRVGQQPKAGGSITYLGRDSIVAQGSGAKVGYYQERAGHEPLIAGFRITEDTRIDQPAADAIPLTAGGRLFLDFPQESPQGSHLLTFADAALFGAGEARWSIGLADEKCAGSKVGTADVGKADTLRWMQSYGMRLEMEVSAFSGIIHVGYFALQVPDDVQALGISERKCRSEPLSRMSQTQVPLLSGSLSVLRFA